MKEEGIHEGCIEQIQRLYADRLFSGKEIPTMKREEFVLTIGKCVLMFKKNSQIIVKLPLKPSELGDLEGYRGDFHNLLDLDLRCDYKADANEMVGVGVLNNTINHINFQNTLI
jgi:enoyl-[acyl-carrier protein] reductase/trans-2-enoyl-CoA reductase (NAD+)